MRFIDSSVEIIGQESGLLGVYKQIERAARLSYKSEDRITEDSAKKMVDTLINNKHLACLEHGTIYLIIPDTAQTAADYDKYVYNQYSRVVDYNDSIYITTNARVLIENNWLEDLKYLSEPTKHHAKRISVKFTTSIGITRELIRHRAFSFMNESTRFCNYSKGKFGKELTFIIPQWIYNCRDAWAPCTRWPDEKMDYLYDYSGEELIHRLIVTDRTVAAYYDLLKKIESEYIFDITEPDGYKLKPEEARGILPMDTKSEIIMTGFVDDWFHFFALRSHIAATGKPHPDIQKLADELLQEFLNRGYITNEDVKNLEDEKRKQTDKND